VILRIVVRFWSRVHSVESKADRIPGNGVDAWERLKIGNRLSWNVSLFGRGCLHARAGDRRELRLIAHWPAFA